MFKYIKLLVFILTISAAAQGQESAKPFIGRTWMVPPAAVIRQELISLGLDNVKPDTTFYQIKPIGGLAYSYPNNVAQAIGGFSYQHIKYKYQTATAPDESYCDYSFNVLYSLGVTSTTKLIDENPSSFGVGVGVYNNRLIVCLLFNAYENKMDPTAKKTIKPVAGIMYSF